MTSIVERQLTEGERPENLVRVVWDLAWPAVALNSLQVINTLLDRGFIGHLDAASLTAYGGATNIMFLMFSMAISLAMGSTAIVARAFGAGERWEYQLASRQGVSLTLVVGALIGLITYFGAAWMSSFILPSSDQPAIREMTRFLHAYAIGLPAIFIIQTLAGALRGIGDTRSPMVISGIQIFLHMGLNFSLVFPSRHVHGLYVPGAGLGFVGASTALSISSWLSAIGYLLYSVKTPLGALYHFRIPDLQWAERILKIAIPAALSSSLRTFSLMAFTLVLALSRDSSVAIAALSIAFSIESIMIMPPFGLAAAAGALVGQSLGMERPERAERIGWIAATHGALVTLTFAVPIFIFAPQIAGILVENKPEITREAAELMRYLCLSESLFAFAMVLFGAMQGAGDTTRPLYITVFSLWCLRVPLALLLALHSGQRLFGPVTVPYALGLGATGSWIAMSGTQGIQGVMAYFAFRQGRWKFKKV